MATLKNDFEITCTICKNTGHTYSQCSENQDKICHICESSEHMAPECTINDGVYFCNLCGRTGHYAKYCRWMKK